ncbi:MAG: hypothetical protein KGO81_06825 [Bacteroidota bacterium]|nr:hypothetical protein [Bacteroidota bacterium]
MKKLITCFTLLIAFSSYSQVGIGTNSPDPSAKLDVTSTNKGFLPPRVALTATNAAGPITNPATGLLVYNTATAGTAPNNVVPGYYYNSGTPSSPVWQLLITQNSVIANGTTQQTANFNISGTGTIGGDATIHGLTIGLGPGAASNNTALGYNALSASASGGNYNTAIGNSALFSNVGSINTAVGVYALHSNTTGSANTAIGSNALQSNIAGTDITSIGYRSLQASTGTANTATGSSSLYQNTSGNYNTAFGAYSLYSNATGNYITALGYQATVAGDGLTNATAIGANAVVAASNTIQLGDGNITSVKTSGKLTTGAVTYPNTDGTSGQILTTNGSGQIAWATNVAVTPAVIGTLAPSGQYVSPSTTAGNSTSNTYLNTSITLPPGKWSVQGNFLLNSTSSSTSWWARIGLSTSNTSFTTDATNFPYSTLISGYCPAGNFGMANGTIIVNNTSGANKTYYLWSGVCTSSGGSGSVSLNSLGSAAWGEDQLIAYPMN